MKNLKLNKNLQNLIKKGATFALVSTLVLTPVKAENTKHYEKYTATQINVTSGIDVFVNGKYFNPKDVNGNIVEPFVYNGTTYLPARAISNIFGAKISWDSTVNGVLIEKNGNKLSDFTEERDTSLQKNKTISAYKGINIYVDGELYMPKNVNGEVVDVFLINGTTYLPVRALANIFDTDITWDSKLNSVCLGHKKAYYNMDEEFNEAMMLAKVQTPIANSLYKSWFATDDVSMDVLMHFCDKLILVEEFYDNTQDERIFNILDEMKEDLHSKITNYRRETCSPLTCGMVDYVRNWIDSDIPYSVTMEDLNANQCRDFNYLDWALELMNDMVNNIDHAKAITTPAEAQKWYDEIDKLYNEALKIYNENQKIKKLC